MNDYSDNHFIQPMILHASPLQGFTDFRFRNLHHQYFGGVDKYYAPYIRFQGNQEIKKSYQRDLDPENNSVPELIPQVMTRSADEFLLVADYVKDMGYTELNWNLGCPYPMVTKRGMGSGLIKETETVDHILEKVFQNTDLEISIKIRLGYETDDEIFALLPVLDKYPLKNIAIHPRIGKQLYKGFANPEAFARCIPKTKHQLIYNGDIFTVADYNHLQATFHTQPEWMLGRGILANPFLPGMIKHNSSQLPNDWRTTFTDFHNALLHQTQEHLSGDKHIIMKMNAYWEYFSLLFPEHKKERKKIKKVISLSDYRSAVNGMISV